MLNRKKTYKTAVIGLGRIALGLEKDPYRKKPCTHTGALWKNPFFKIVEVVDTNPFKLEKYFALTGADINYRNKIAKNRAVEVVVVATDSHTHYKYLKEILFNYTNIKSVICEKPFCESSEHIEEIKNLYNKKNISVYINYTRRYSNRFMKVKNIINKNNLGKLLKINGEINAGGQGIKESLLYHDGVHLIDTCFYLVSSKAENIYIRAKSDKDSIYEAFLNYEAGDVLLSLGFSCRAEYFLFEITLFFQQGKIIVGNQGLKIFKSKESTSFYGFKELKQISIKEADPEYVLNKNTCFKNFYNHIAFNLNNNIIEKDGLKQAEFTSAMIQNILAMKKQVDRRLL
ncbi:MAG: Gfo/Idh/MocA family protein [Candidatus Muiribacteriota bacterium]